MAAVAAAQAAANLAPRRRSAVTATPVQAAQPQPRNRTAASNLADEERNSYRLSQVSVNSKASSSHKRARARIGPWQLGRTLGRGSSGRVRLAKHSETGQLAAVKILPKSVVEPLVAAVASQLPTSGAEVHQAAAGSLPYGLEREVIIMKLIEHPNIMGLYDVWENKGELYLVLEYIEGGELFDYLISRGRLSERESIHYFRQICYGVDYCHQFNICHRDLKPENLLLDKHRDIKIADFGMAALETHGRLLETSCGSPHYASPEIVAGRNYHGAPSDIWSCGIILFALLTGHLPFDDDNIRQLLLKVQSGVYKMPTHLSPEAKDLIKRMLLVNPEDRITMKEIFAHPLMAKYPSRRIPAVNTDMVRMVNASQPVRSRGEIDMEILRNLKTLWHRDSTEQIIEQLLSPVPNPEKTFYCLLVRYRENHLHKRAGVPSQTRKALAPISANRAAPINSPTKAAVVGDSSNVRESRHKSRHQRNASTSSRRSNNSARSSGKSKNAPRSASHRSVSSGYRVQFPRRYHRRSPSGSGHASSRSISAATNDHAPIAVGPAHKAVTTVEEAAHDLGISRVPSAIPEARPQVRVPSAARTSTPAPPVLPVRSEVSHARNSQFAELLDHAFNFEEVRAVSGTVPLEVSLAADADRRVASEPARAPILDPGSNFDFSETPVLTAEIPKHPYLLPMIFEEDRFADAVEEEVELKLHKRRAKQPGAARTTNSNVAAVAEDDSRLRVSDLLTTAESFYNYQPSVAAASVPPPVRPAPPIPSSLPTAVATTTTAAAPRTTAAAPMTQDGSLAQRRYNVYAAPKNFASVLRKPVPLEDAQKPAGGQPFEIYREPSQAHVGLPPAQVETAEAPATQPKGRAPSPTASMEVITPFVTPPLGPALGDLNVDSVVAGKRERHLAGKRAPGINDSVATAVLQPPIRSVSPAKATGRSPLAAQSVNQETVRASADKFNEAPQRHKSILRRLAPKRNETPKDKTLLAAKAEMGPMMVTSNDYLEASSPVTEKAEPRQNWFFKMLNISNVPNDSSTKTLLSTLDEERLAEVINGIFDGWKRYGLTHRQDDAGVITAMISPRNALKLRQARFTVRIKAVKDGSTAVCVLQRGSRTSYMRFVSELERVLDSARLLGAPTNLH